ncbi:helix-turn-helix domain-containing protein [Streptomyces genisteinicus]|uniref:Helix-turn-helix domain-containing protein n=1 Tax=Streptomyces genisteinicus TaxID=2768068 RepID=A0A7H0HUM1_9ACTN|nr:helix-turn-helix transcriptional regulator [Streptomyces genisteinicus]QNP64237.1 helix-turn-helix domain-containing protein [Streptomyces genisteinicus]
MTAVTTGRVPSEPLAPLAPLPPRLPLRGRGPETDRALGALRSGAARGGALVAVEGVPGSGKTRFLDELVAGARRLGYADCLRPPFCDPPVPAADSGEPVLVVLDDAHFLGDEACDALLARHRRHRAGGPVVWLVARHGGAGAGRLDAVLAGSVGRTERITLGPLGGPASLQVAADILGAPPSAPLARVVRSAGGHPELLVELVRGLWEERLVRVDADEARLVEERIPQRLRDLLHGRLRDYPDEGRQLLRVAAVLGRECAVDDLLPVLRAAPSALLLTLDRATAAGLLTVGDTRVRFPNELLWQLVVDSVPAGLRHALRRQVAAARPADGPGGGRGEGPAAPPVPGPGTDRAAPAGPPDLNGQEHRIIRMIAEGLTNKQIARRLGISPHTVNYHLKKLFRKAGVNSRIALLRETGWHDRPDGSPQPGPVAGPGPEPFEGRGEGQ